MKWVFYVIVFIYMGYRAVYGKNLKLINDISIERPDYGNETFIKAGFRKAIDCKGANRNQKIEWLDPLGKVIKRVPTSRVFTQEHIASANNGRSSVVALLLVFSELMVKDSGLYKCRSGPKVEELPLCVMSPPEFVNTATEVTAELGRSITLSCQAKGHPEPILAWMRDNEEITEDNNTTKHRVNTKYNSRGFESLLTIMDLEPEDSGEYQCLAMQKTPDEICENTATQNITLQVSYAPTFENENDTKPVYGNVNDIVNLTCSAGGFPSPTYRWFKAVSDDTLAEFDQKQIKKSAEENKAVLQVIATPATIGKTFKCLATNALGEAEKYFTLFEIQPPTKPDMVKFVISTDTEMLFAVSWLKHEFPVEGFAVQYIQTKKKPSEREWRRAVQVYKEVDDDSIFLEFPVSLDELEEDSPYWVRVRASNDAGESPWSDPEFASTDVKSAVLIDVDLDLDEDEDAEETVADASETNVTFYGIFFAGGILVIAVLFMIIMKMV